MAIKKYNEFPAGIYDVNKIFLQADPETGALEKVNLPAIPQIKQLYCRLDLTAYNECTATEFINTIGHFDYSFFDNVFIFIDSANLLTSNKTICFYSLVSPENDKVVLNTQSLNPSQLCLFFTSWGPHPFYNNYSIFLNILVFP